MPYKSKDKYNSYHKSYQLKRYYKRRKIAIEYLGGQCHVCGEKDGLEFDHKDFNSKSFNISRLWSVSEAVFYEEVKKCQLLCSDHHREKTKEENKSRRPITHGKHWAAYKHKCQCTVCISYKEKVNYERRKARRASNSNG